MIKICAFTTCKTAVYLINPVCLSTHALHFPLVSEPFSHKPWQLGVSWHRAGVCNFRWKSVGGGTHKIVCFDLDTPCQGQTHILSLEVLLSCILSAVSCLHQHPGSIPRDRDNFRFVPYNGLLPVWTRRCFGVLPKRIGDFGGRWTQSGCYQHSQQNRWKAN